MLVTKCSHSENHYTLVCYGTNDNYPLDGGMETVICIRSHEIGNSNMVRVVGTVNKIGFKVKLGH
jgi:hypothetical protein